MVTNMTIPRGTRKARANRETQLMLLAGFAIAAWMR